MLATEMFWGSYSGCLATRIEACLHGTIDILTVHKVVPLGIESTLFGT